MMRMPRLLKRIAPVLACFFALNALAGTNGFYALLDRADEAWVRNDTRAALALLLDAVTNHPDAEYALRRIDDMELDALQRALLTNALATRLGLLDLPARRLALDILATLCRSLGDNAAARQYFLALAPLTNWLIVGGFDNAERAGLGTAFEPEARLGRSEIYDGKQWPVTWRPAFPLRSSFGVDLQLVRPEAWLTVYLRSGLLAPTAMHAMLSIEFPGALRVWLNGAPIAEETRYREPHTEMYYVPLALRAGTNFLVVKLCAEDNDSVFLSRLALPSGAPLMLPNIQPDDTTVPLVCTPTSSWPRALLSYATRRWKSARAAAPEDLLTARMLARFYAVTRRDEQAISLYEALLQKHELPAADLYAAAQCHARKNSDSQAAALYRRALALDPLANAARTALGRHYLDREMYDLALPLLHHALATSSNDLDARVALISLYCERDWNEDALRLARETCALFPQHDLAHRTAAEAAQDAGSEPLAEAALLAALACRPATLYEREALIRLYQRQCRFDAAAQHIDILRAYYPTEPVAWLLTLRNYLVQRDPTNGIRASQQALAIFPDHATFHRRLGDFYNMLGRLDDAITAYRTCLVYEPNFLWLRRYLDFLTGKSDAFFVHYDRSEESCVALARAALAQPLPRDERQFTVLLRSVLVQLYQDGSSRQQFHFMLRALSPRGVQNASSVDLPASEVLRAVTYKPDGRILEATHISSGQIEFPDVQVGDVIEYKYRIDRYGGSWLDQHFFSLFAFDVGQSDVQRAEVVLAVPTNRVVTWISRPALIRPRRARRDGTDIFRWSLRNIPVLASEPLAPAYLDLAHRVAVSTIPGWHVIADWQRGMLSDVTRGDTDLRRLAAEITAGATTDTARAAALFRFITANFRYTQMYETRIASIKPHPVPDILANRCGDCKDLSMLLIELLKAAGIEAHPALIRTLDDGHIITNVPSPDVFNHMIVYAPRLDGGRFIDPTFRHADWDLLPPMCQGVWAFVVDDTGYHFIKTPVAPPQDCRSELSFTGVIARDGSCSGRMDLVLHRLEAADARASIERVDDLRKIGSYYVSRIEPSARLTDFAAEHITPSNVPIIVRMGFASPRFAQPGASFLSLSLPWPLEPERLHGGLERRTHPLRLPSLVDEHRYYDFILPPGATCSIPTTNLTLRSRFGAFTFSAHQTSSTLSAAWHLRLSQRDIPSASYSAFHRFLSRCATTTSQIILIHPPQDTESKNAETRVQKSEVAQFEHRTL